MNKNNLEKEKQIKLKNEDILYFLHIPKTAGLSMIYMLNGFFNYSSILIEHSWDQLLPKLPKDFSRYRFVRGHFGFGFYRHFKRKPVYITMLRDPIEQSISGLEMLRRQPNLRSKYDISSKLNFDQLIESKIPPNLQTKFIAIDVDVIESVKSIQLNNLSEFNFHHLKEYVEQNISNEKFIEVAKKNLSEFAFVGITEKFDESMLLLCYTFDWVPIFNKRKFNVAKKRKKKEDFSKEIIDLVRKKIDLDTELYNYGKNLFEQRYLEMVNELKEQYYDEKFSKLSETIMVYGMLKRKYIENHGEKKFLMECLKFNFRKVNFVIRYGWKTRIMLRLKNIIKSN